MRLCAIAEDVDYQSFIDFSKLEPYHLEKAIKDSDDHKDGYRDKEKKGCDKNDNV